MSFFYEGGQFFAVEFNPWNFFDGHFFISHAICQPIRFIVPFPSSYLVVVVRIAILEYGFEVLNAVPARPVESVLQTLADGPQIHGVTDEFVIILEGKTS